MMFETGNYVEFWPPQHSIDAYDNLYSPNGSMYSDYSDNTSFKHQINDKFR